MLAENSLLWVAALVAVTLMFGLLWWLRRGLLSKLLALERMDDQLKLDFQANLEEARNQILDNLVAVGKENCKSVSDLRETQSSSNERLEQVSDSLTSVTNRLETEIGELRQVIARKAETIEKIQETQSSSNERLEQVSDSLTSVTNRLESEIGELRQVIVGKAETIEKNSAAIHQIAADLKRALDAPSERRLGDVEHLAIVAALLASDALTCSEPKYTTASGVHGHALMMYQMILDYSISPKIAGESGIHLLEIGTTRETVWPQMSTSRLAATCRALGYRMHTVDIDPENTAAAGALKSTYGATISAECSAGEDFLAAWEGELPPYIYIDAYDYDHGEHSEERQGRYIELLELRISNKDCWEMHRKCAEQFISKCPKDGIVVFDDAFFDGNTWSGKAKTAAPLMLENGFELIARSDSTAILCKQ